MTDSARPDFSRRSTARVTTDRPARYGKQLAGHMGRKITTAWDEDAETGSLAFDREGYRLGRGKGYYDRYLSRCPHASRIGVTFALRPIACLPHDPWDLPVEAVLTSQPALL